MIRGKQAITAPAAEPRSPDDMDKGAGGCVSRGVAKSCEPLQAFAGAIVHDWNNILTAIIGNLSLLRDNELLEGSPFTAIIDEALAASRRGTHLAEAVEAMAGRLRLSPEPTEINRLIYTAMAGLRWRLEGLELRTRLSPAPVLAYVDAALLRRAISGAAICLAREICAGAHTLTIEATSTQSRPGVRHAAIRMSCDGRHVDAAALETAHTHRHSLTLLRDDEWRLMSVAGFLAQSGGQLTTAVPSPGRAQISLDLPMETEAPAGDDQA